MDNETEEGCLTALLVLIGLAILSVAFLWWMLGIL